MRTLALALFIVSCNNPPTFTPVVCDNLVCFPDYTAKVGPPYSTKEECKQHLNNMHKDKNLFYYCRER